MHAPARCLRKCGSSAELAERGSRWQTSMYLLAWLRQSGMLSEVGLSARETVGRWEECMHMPGGFAEAKWPGASMAVGGLSYGEL